MFFKIKMKKEEQRKGLNLNGDVYIIFFSADSTTYYTSLHSP